MKSHTSRCSSPFGVHGFHITFRRQLLYYPDFSAAGGHLTPIIVEGQGHGFMQGEFHTGDMPNIHAAADGTVRADVFNTRVIHLRRLIQ